MFDHSLLQVEDTKKADGKQGIKRKPEIKMQEYILVATPMMRVVMINSKKRSGRWLKIRRLRRMRFRHCH